VPNRNGTWVSQVTKDDIGTILTDRKKDTTHAILDEWSPDDTAEYIEDGKWKDGEKGAIRFFESVKKFDGDVAERIGKHVHANPTILSVYQLESMSHDDLDAWWKSVEYQRDAVKKLQEIEDRLHVQEKNTRRLLMFDHNKKDMRDYLKIIEGKRYGQSEVGYTDEAAENNCRDCRWFAPNDPENPDGIGECSEVADEVRGTGSCDRFDRNPSTPEPEDPEENEGEEGEGNEEDEPMMERIPEGRPKTDTKTKSKTKDAVQRTPQRSTILDANKMRMGILESEYDRLDAQPITKYTQGRMADIRAEYRELEKALQAKKK